jgi:hypothetical protein
MPPGDSAVSHEHLIPITINHQPFKVEVPITGAQLRALGHIPDANQLFEERHGQDPDFLIEPGASYEPKSGTHYYDLPPGTVGAATIQEQLDYAVEHLEAARREVQEDETHLLRWRTRVPPDWDPAEVTLVIVVPPTYPAQAPSGFDSVSALHQNGAAPTGSGVRDLAGTSLMHFCWNPNGQIDYAALDGLWRFAKFSEKRFLS